MSDYNMHQHHWGAPAFPERQHIQLEEEYYTGTPAQMNGHNQHHPGAHHTASYPVSAQPPNRLAANQPGQQRSQTYHGPTYNHNAGIVYTDSLGQPSQSTFQQPPRAPDNRFPAQPSYRPPYPPLNTTSLHGSPSFGNGFAPHDASTSPPAFSASPMPTPLVFDSHPLPAQAHAQHHSYRDTAQPPITSSSHDSEQARQVKRHRVPQEEEDAMDMAMVDDEDEDADRDPKTKLGGACQRCKGLKVRCEFIPAEDACKRCVNAGKPCWIPGRKKRRTPPKREHLLAQIRAQTLEIEQLVAQLEATKKQPRVNTAVPRALPNTDLLSPLDPKSPSSVSSKPDVEEWIAKARESIEAFGGLIGAGGVAMTQSFLVDQDPEGSGSSEEEYEIAVHDEDGESVDVGEHDDHETRARERSASREQESLGAGARPLTGTGPQKLVTLPISASPFGLMANLSLKHGRRIGSPGVAEEEDVGVASNQYFKPERTPDQETIRTPTDARAAPHILTRGVITPDEAEKLFRIYFDNMNLSCSLLDPVLYTAQKTCYRSPFLFTVICAIASRFFIEKPSLYLDLMHYAQLAAGTSLINGHKNVEVCQGYILLSLYPVPARKWEDHRSWLYLGLAIRVASDLNLHLPNTAKPLNEHHAREMLNRTRVWLNCFNLDRSTGSQYGKPPIIPNSDYVANHSEKWWKSSDYNFKNFDIQLCGYNAELKVMARFGARIYNDPNHPTGLNKKADFQKIAFETDDELKTLGHHWFTLLAQTDQTDTQNRFRTGLLKIAYSYSRLVALALAFHHAFGKSGSNDKALVNRCLAAAYDIANTYVNDVGRPAQRVYIRHGPEAQSVFVTFAASFLVKLLHNKYSAYLSPEKRWEIRELVQSVADLLGSPEVAIDDRHSPKLYSRFLTGLLATPMAHVDGASSANGSQRKPPRRAASLSSEPESFSLNSSSPISPTTPASNFARESSPVVHFVAAATPPSFSPYNNSPAQGSTELNINDWFPTPLSFDTELVQSMQSVQESVWGQDVAVAGFNWMNNMSQSNSQEFSVPSNDVGNMYNHNYFIAPTPPA